MLFCGPSSVFCELGNLSNTSVTVRVIWFCELAHYYLESQFCVRCARSLNLITIQFRGTFLSVIDKFCQSHDEFQWHSCMTTMCQMRMLT